MKSEINVLITAEENGMRIDSAVSKLNPKISRTKAGELIKKGEIQLDNLPTKVSAKVKEGQTITMPSEVENEVDEKLVAEDIPIDILYEDNDIVVVNKPKDMVVHPAAGNWSGTLVNAMLGKTELSDENGVEKGVKFYRSSGHIYVRDEYLITEFIFGKNLRYFLMSQDGTHFKTGKVFHLFSHTHISALILHKSSIAEPASF